MVIRKRLRAEVRYNDGENAEIVIVGTEGTEAGRLLDVMQINRLEIVITPEAFQKGLPVGKSVSFIDRSRERRRGRSKSKAEG